MVCKQHMVMLTKQWKAEREASPAGADDGWVDAGVRELVDESPPEYSEVIRETPRLPVIRAGQPSLATRKRAEQERLGALVMASIEKGVYADETCTLADHSGRWLWTVPPSNAKTPPTGYWGQFDIDGRLLMRCTCPGCAPKPRSKAKLCERPVMTTDHCVRCTCKTCVCPARAMYGMHSERALTGWWDNPCGGKCGGCKRLARENAAGAARGWTA